MTKSEEQTWRAMWRSLLGGIGGGCLGVVGGFLLLAFVIPMFRPDPPQADLKELGVLEDFVHGFDEFMRSLSRLIFGVLGAIGGGVIGSITGSLLGIRSSTLAEPTTTGFPYEKPTKHK